MATDIVVVVDDDDDSVVTASVVIAVVKQYAVASTKNLLLFEHSGATVALKNEQSNSCDIEMKKSNTLIHIRAHAQHRKC